MPVRATQAPLPPCSSVTFPVFFAALRHHRAKSHRGPEEQPSEGEGEEEAAGKTRALSRGRWSPKRATLTSEPFLSSLMSRLLLYSAPCLGCPHVYVFLSLIRVSFCCRVSVSPSVCVCVCVCVCVFLCGRLYPPPADGGDLGSRGRGSEWNRAEGHLGPLASVPS